eukprot:scaffold69881_cov57-Phaeocystis_antarctica.AAC.1
MAWHGMASRTREGRRRTQEGHSEYTGRPQKAAVAWVSSTLEPHSTSRKVARSRAHSVPPRVQRTVAARLSEARLKRVSSRPAWDPVCWSTLGFEASRELAEALARVAVGVHHVARPAEQGDLVLAALHDVEVVGVHVALRDEHLVRVGVGVRVRVRVRVGVRVRVRSPSATSTWSACASTSNICDMRSRRSSGESAWLGVGLGSELGLGLLGLGSGVRLGLGVGLGSSGESA